MFRLTRGKLAATALLAVAVSSAVLTRPAAPVAAQPAKTLSADLALVPGDALGFAHVRVADIWKSDGMAEFRRVVERAGPNAFAALDADFTPAPSTIDRVTTVLLPFKDKPDPRMVTILAFAKPFDAAKVKARYMSRGVEGKANGKAFTADKQMGVAVHFHDDRTLVFGDSDTLPQFLELGGPADGPLADPLRAGGTGSGTAPLVAAVNLKALPIPDEVSQNLPLDLRPLLKAERVVLTADAAKDVSVSLAVGFGTEADAAAGEKALRKAADMGRAALTEPRRMAEQMVVGMRPRAKGEPRPLEELIEAVGGVAALGGINTVDDLLAELPFTTTGKTVAATVKLPPWTAQFMGLGMVSAGVALPAVQKARNAAARMQSTNNLKQIALAMHNYHDAHGTFPPAAIVDKKGKKLLSWRVAILPYIEQDNLYRQFKLDEPWDSEHNKPLSAVSIKTYMDPRLSEFKPGTTNYRLFVGGGSPFDWLQGKSIANITDGTSNTIMVVAAGDPIPWAKPEDFEFDPKKDLPDLKKPFPELIAAFCDGSVRVLRPDQIKDFDKLMKLLIQANDGTPIPFDF